MEISNDLILKAINDNSVEVAKLRERIDAMLIAHAEVKDGFGLRIKSLEKRQWMIAGASLAACGIAVIQSGKGANILAALINMI